MRKIFDSPLWDRSHRLTVALHRFMRALPAAERPTLGMEISRAASDMVVMIAEGLQEPSARRARALWQDARTKAHELECLLLILAELPFLNRRMLRVLLRENQKILSLLAERRAAGGAIEGGDQTRRIALRPSI